MNDIDVQESTVICDGCGRLCCESWILIPKKRYKNSNKVLSFCSTKCKKDRLNKEKFGVYED